MTNQAHDERQAIPVIHDEGDEAWLQPRDDRAERLLRKAIDDRREEARELRRQADELSRDANEIEKDVKAERWYKLGGILGDETVESLCDVSPTDLLGRSDES